MPKFKIIKGGLPDKPSYKFIDAYVTDTRLMGVLGLRVHWLMYPIDPNDIDGIKDIYHFYYYDIEELGLDSLKIFELSDDEAVRLATKSCFGGLGANMMMVSEKEARYLINSFVDGTIAKKEELPKSLSQASFVLEEKPVLTEEEIDNLSYKMCTGIRTNYGVVNYYLMRMFGYDFEGAKLLRDKKASKENFDEVFLSAAATFLQNSIEEFKDDDGKVSYLSESLVQTETGHSIVTSEIQLEGQRVIYAKKKREFEISVEEASMILLRHEYVTAYKILVPMETFDADFASFSIGTTKTSHENGDMYMDFRPNNDHVEEKVFNLNADLAAIYFVADSGELLVGSYSPEDMVRTENTIRNSSIMPDTFLVARMQFANEMIYEFAQSGFLSFADFIQSLNIQE